MREGYILTRKEAGDLFLILSQARLKLTEKYKTLANKYWENFEIALGVSTKEVRDGINKE